MVDFNPYNVLGVPMTASEEEIKSAYRRIARRLHPDANPNNKGAMSQFQDVTVAYELLTDTLKRRAYDRQLSDMHDQKVFTMNIISSKKSVSLLNEQQVMYLLAEIHPDPRAEEDIAQRRETRVNITLVLDHSNSMAGTRLEKVKIAAHQIIDDLTDQDIISVVTFNDRAHVVIPATYAKDKPGLKAKISMMTASGGTEIFQGLQAGVEQTRQYLGPKMVNHIILLTDGRTYGDERQCLDLAAQAIKEGISISAMGLGNDWNDEFLDQIATKTGGNSAYINKASAVAEFLNEHVRRLTNTFAERLKLSVAPDPDISLELAFKLSPNPQPLEHAEGDIMLGSLQANRPMTVLLQLTLPAELNAGFRSLARIVVSGDILSNLQQRHTTVSDISIDVTEAESYDDPPAQIMDALSKLTLYRLQERATEALTDGNIVEATKRLENLATRLLEMGQKDLANQTLSEARRVAYTHGLSEGGKKAIKYQTRYLIASDNNKYP